MLKAALVVLTVLLTIVILLGSLAPTNARTILHMHSRRPVTIPGMPPLTAHRLIHFIAFGSLTTCASLACRSRSRRLLAAAAVLALGLTIETVQFLTTNNRFELWDVRDDAVAVLVGYLLSEGISISAQIISTT